MADLTANNTNVSAEGGSYDFEVTMDSSTAQTVWKGHPVILDLSVDAEHVRVWNSGDEFIDGVDLFIGIAAEAKSITSGSDESTNTLNVWTGVIGLDNTSLSWTVADIGKEIYMPDSGTFELTRFDSSLYIGVLYNISTDGNTAFVALKYPESLFTPDRTPRFSMTRHGLVDALHSVDGSAGQLVGLVGENTPGLITPTSNAVATPGQPMKSDANGDMRLRYLTVSLIDLDDVQINKEFSTNHLYYLNDSDNEVFWGLSDADDSWQTPTYVAVNGWSDFDAGSDLITEFRMMGDGMAIMKILAKCSDASKNNTTMLTLPSYIRPQKPWYYPAQYNNNDEARVVINPNGNVVGFSTSGITVGQLFSAVCVWSIL